MTIAELAEHPLLLEPRGTAFRDDLDVDAARAGVVLVPQAEVDGMRLLASLAFAGFGAAVLPATAAPPDRHRRTVASASALTGVTPRSVGLATPASLASSRLPAAPSGTSCGASWPTKDRSHPGVLAGRGARRPPRAPVRSHPTNRRPPREQRLRG